MHDSFLVMFNVCFKTKNQNILKLTIINLPFWAIITKITKARRIQGLSKIWNTKLWILRIIYLLIFKITFVVSNINNFFFRLLDICHGKQEQVNRLNLVLVFEYVEQDLHTYLQRCPSPGLDQNTIKVCWLKLWRLKHFYVLYFKKLS